MCLWEQIGNQLSDLLAYDIDFNLKLLLTTFHIANQISKLFPIESNLNQQKKRGASLSSSLIKFSSRIRSIQMNVAQLTFYLNLFTGDGDLFLEHNFGRHRYVLLPVQAQDAVVKVLGVHAVQGVGLQVAVDVQRLIQHQGLFDHLGRKYEL